MSEQLDVEVEALRKELAQTKHELVIQADLVHVLAKDQRARVAFAEKQQEELETLRKENAELKARPAVPADADARMNLALLELMTGMGEDSYRGFGRVLALQEEGQPARDVPAACLIGIGGPIVRKMEQLVEKMGKKAERIIEAPTGLIVPR
jgi:hypothetical protein